MAWAQTAPAEPARESGYRWEAGVSVGHDFGSEQRLWAASLARHLGDGLKVEFEYADGRHGDEGSKVTSLKLVKEFWRWHRMEFGAGLGGAYVNERHDHGWGVLASIEALYPITERWWAKLEVSRLFGVGGFNETRATVLQGGVVFKF
jgi:hypothetical protein